MEKKFVYAIGPSGGPLKIGIADNCHTRRSILNVGNHLYLRLWHFVDANDQATAVKIERSVHYHFQDNHIRGEWFQLTENDLPNVKQAMHVANIFEYDLEDWSLERKSCDEFAPIVCRRARGALGLTVQQLAAHASILPITLDAFENGTSSANIATIESLKSALEALGVEFIREQPGKSMRVLI
jgi:DNA-binding XRE family transcriptional regulator